LPEQRIPIEVGKCGSKRDLRSLLLQHDQSRAQAVYPQGNMNYVKTIVCFANSRKTSGRCIAGKEWQKGHPGEWVRPISNRTSHEVSEEERRYEDGQDPRLLDIVNISCKRHQPSPHQSENHVIDSDYYWEKQGRVSWKDLHAWLDSPDSLWDAGEGSYAGINNRVSVGQQNGTSLFLIRVEKLHLLVGKKAPQYSAKRSVQGEFTYQGLVYRMDVTDPVIERDYLSKPDGQYNIPHPVLCISLGDPYQASVSNQSYYYKLIAAVLYQERFA
jgi:hypothetical protein